MLYLLYEYTTYKEITKVPPLPTAKNTISSDPVVYYISELFKYISNVAGHWWIHGGLKPVYFPRSTSTWHNAKHNVIIKLCGQ